MGSGETGLTRGQTGVNGSTLKALDINIHKKKKLYYKHWVCEYKYVLYACWHVYEYINNNKRFGENTFVTLVKQQKSVYSVITCVHGMTRITIHWQCVHTCKHVKNNIINHTKAANKNKDTS